MRGTKENRQILMNEVAVQVLRERPSLLRSPILRKAMRMTRQHTSGAYYLPYLDEWDRFLDSGDVEKVALHVLANDEHGRALRVTSPLPFLLTEEQRVDVITRAMSASVHS